MPKKPKKQKFSAKQLIKRQLSTPTKSETKSKEKPVLPHSSYSASDIYNTYINGHESPQPERNSPLDSPNFSGKGKARTTSPLVDDTRAKSPHGGSRPTSPRGGSRPTSPMQIILPILELGFSWPRRKKGKNKNSRMSIMPENGESSSPNLEDGGYHSQGSQEDDRKCVSPLTTSVTTPPAIEEEEEEEEVRQTFQECSKVILGSPARDDCVSPASDNSIDVDSVMASLDNVIQEILDSDDDVKDSTESDLDEKNDTEFSEINEFDPNGLVSPINNLEKEKSKSHLDIPENLKYLSDSKENQSGSMPDIMMTSQSPECEQETDLNKTSPEKTHPKAYEDRSMSMYELPNGIIKDGKGTIPKRVRFNMNHLPLRKSKSCDVQYLFEQQTASEVKMYENKIIIQRAEIIKVDGYPDKSIAIEMDSFEGIALVCWLMILIENYRSLIFLSG